jgi:hypothetical protein
VTGSGAASILWRRLDAPGHDCCLLAPAPGGWSLYGTAVYHQDGVPARLTYHIASSLAWRTQHGRIRGWLGVRLVEFSIARMAGGVWTLNGAVVPGLQSCVDLDLGFTPATNLLQLRRIALQEGQGAEVPVAWLDVMAGTLEVLEQRYERRGESTYWYEAPGPGYSGMLEVTPDGFIRRYPGLWESE